jgi:S-DNA-T family DNA segregation ATPase FtsK/SpoIIIE
MERDPLFEEIARMVVNSDAVSVSALQRKYMIGYNRVSRIVDQLCEAGIVEPSNGGKPRKVLVNPESLGTIIDDIEK